MEDVPETRIAATDWFIMSVSYKLSLESYILTDGECPISNSNRELQGGGVYIRFVIGCAFPLDDGGKHVTGISSYTAFVRTRSS